MLAAWRDCLDEDESSEEACNRIYHATCRDFLTEGVGLADHHRTIGQTTLSKVPGVPSMTGRFDALSDYEVTHLVYHLAESESVDWLCAVLTDFEFLETVLDRDVLQLVLADATAALRTVQLPADGPSSTRR